MKYFIAIAALLGSSALAPVNAVTFSTNNNFNYEFSYSDRDVLSGGVTLAAGHNDNYLYLQDGAQSTSFFQIIPDAFLQIRNDQHLFQSYYKLNSVIVSDNSDDSYNDHDFKVKYQFSRSLKHRVFISTAYETEHEERGENLTRGESLSLLEPDERRDVMINTGYQYGNIESVSRLTALLGYRKQDYQTRELETGKYDFDSLFGVLDGDYSLSSVTALRATVEYEQIDYNEDVFVDSDQLAIFTGLKWKSRELYTFDLLMGYQFIDFDDDTTGDTFSWRVTGVYSPLSYSRFNFSSGRYVKQNNTEAQLYRLVDEHQVAWQHQFTDTFAGAISSRYIIEEQNSDVTEIEEKYWKNEVALSWQANSQIAYKVRYLYNDLDSDLENVSNDQQQVILEMSAVF